MKEESLLSVRNLKTYFYTEDGVMPSVDGVDFELSAGETLAIVGESGCGKSVTSLSIMGLVQCPPGKIVDGEILYKGQDLLKMNKKEMRAIRGNEISMIFQEPMTSLNPVFTVGQQIMDSFRIHQKLGKKEAREKTIEMIRMVGIPSPEKVVDMRLLGEMKEKTGTSIIIITHDLGVVAQIAQNAMVMYAGQVVEYVPTRSIYKDPLHPYTAGLLKSIPKLNEETDTLYSIKGMVPSPKDYPKGCRFCPRCEEAKGVCQEKQPPLLKLADGRKVRCWKYDEQEGKHFE